MGDISNTQGVSNPEPPVVEPTAAVTSSTPSGTVPASIHSLAELKALCPPLYQAILMALAMQVKRQQDAANAEFKKILRDAQSQARG